MGKSLTERLTIIAFMIVLFFGAYARAHATTNTLQIQMDKLPEIVHVLQGENFRVHAWSLYARQSEQSLESPSDFYKKVDQLQATLAGFQWDTVTVDEQNHYKVNGTRSVHANTTESITLFAYPRKNEYKTYLIYVVEGESWNVDDWKKFSPLYHNRVKTLFDNNGKIFAWASGTTHDKMNFVMSKQVNGILTHFNAKTVEQDIEKTFVSVSAYTNEWKNSIRTNGQKMNLQVGLRTTPKNTTVTVGTPIITTEY